MFQADAKGFLALVAFTMCLGLALVLFRVGAPRSVARKLSLLLIVEGVTLMSTGYIDLFLTTAAQVRPFYSTFFKVEEFIHTLGDCVMLALYPPFLAAALQTRLTRPFATKRMQLGLWVVSLLLFFAVILGPLKFGATLLYFLLTLLFIFALVASIQAWYSSKGPARASARSFTVAFGFRDICWGFVYGGAIWAIWDGTYLVVDPEAVGPVYIIYALGTLLAVPLIAYGILRNHLFDIDLRIRWTIKQSTLAAIVVTFIFVISEAASELLSSELGTVGGLLAAGIVVFFLAPLQSFAERVAGAAMPNTHNTAEYTAYRKMQVYESAVAEALLEDGISAKERALLNVLRDTLGIRPADAEALERDIQPGQSRQQKCTK